MASRHRPHRTARWLILLAVAVLVTSACDDVTLDANGLAAEPAATPAAAEADEDPEPRRPDATAETAEPQADQPASAAASDEPDDEAVDQDGTATRSEPSDGTTQQPNDAPASTAAAEEPAPVGSYGAGTTGPAAERCQTTGTRISSAGAIGESGTFLLRAGGYGALKVPSGVTVKPYDCEDVTINGSVTLGNGATLAGVTVRSDSNWVIRIGGRDITVRNSTVKGGAIEAIRIFDDAADVRLTGNNIDGGRNNHTVKVISENGSAHPSRIRIDHNRFSKRYYGTSSEDLLQLEGHHDVTVANNTFEGNPRGEDGLDVKRGRQGIVVEGNDFRGGTIKDECLMVSGGQAENVIRNNRFSDCAAVSLGAGYDTWPRWRFEDNHLTDSQLRIRRSQGAEVVDNYMTGGQLTLGIPREGDDPQGLTLSNNTFVGVRILNGLRYDYASCSGNVLERVTGDPIGC